MRSTGPGTTPWAVASETIAGATIGFGYDGDGLLAWAGSLRIDRDPANGRLTRSTLGATTDEYAYDSEGRLETYVARHGTSEVLRQQYVRDAVGRITEKRESGLGGSRIEAYGYDAAGRLETVTRDGVLAATYAYDANGNRLAKITPSGVESGTYDDQDRMLSWGGASYTYTANGELAMKTDASGTTTYDYDVLGNLRRVDLADGTLIEYVIDGQNRRVGKKVNGVLERGWLYADQLEPVAELDGAGTVVSRFVYGTRTNVPDFMIRGGVTYRIVPDHLGSVRYVVDVATGAIAQAMRYDEFGVVVEDTNPGWQPFRFAGGMYDASVGVTRFGARDYDAETGRWTAKDPIGFAGGSANLYSYTFADPINFIDPTGLKLCKKWLPGIGWTFLDDQFAPAVDDFLFVTNELGVPDLEVNSAFRSSAKQAAMRKNPAKYGAITPAKNSLHSAGWAIDSNFGDYSSGVQDQILDAASEAGLSWGGNFKKSDPVHFYIDPTKGNTKLRQKLIKQAQDEYNAGGVCGCD